MINILLIDSGVFLHPKISCVNICRTGFRGQYSVEDILDTVGHGTAVAFLLIKGIDISNIRLSVVKLFDDVYDCSIEDLLECLEYVSEHNEYDLINMSFGVVSGYECEQIERLKFLCNKIKNQGTIIVAAYDNTGAISYPAYFESVIGVDSSPKVNKRYEYEFVMNSCVNIRGYGKNQKVAWVKPDYTIIEGNSFSCANISNVIIDKLLQKCKKEDILKELQKNAMNTICFDDYVPARTRPKWLHRSRVITFPFNKEIHSIYAYEDMLDFQIIAAYDVKYRALIGKNIDEILSYKKIKRRSINNYDNIDWKSDLFDTVILGHVGELSAICKRNFLEEIMNNCIKNGKKLFAFDDLSEYASKFANQEKFNECCYFPEVTYQNIPKGRFGKLFGIQMPILGIVGTSSSQGKLTIQMELRRKLMEQGYNVGQIGTEPTAFCYDMDFVYPYGYKSTVKTVGYHNVLLLNNIIHDIEMKGCDICLVGAQTNIAAYAYVNLKNIPLFQEDFLYGTMPDSFFLVVNVHDEAEYIKRTMKTVELMVESKCLGIIVYPIMQKQVIGTLYKKVYALEEDYLKFSESLSKEVTVPIIKFEEALNTNILVELIFSFFTE